MFADEFCKSVALNNGKNILIYRLGSLGDTVVALPAFHAVRRAFGNSRITLLTNTPVNAKAAPAMQVVGPRYFVDDTIDYPLHTRSPVVLWHLIRKIRARKVDTVVNLAAFRSFARTRRDALFFRAAGARSLIGFKLGPRDAQGWRQPESGETEWEAVRIARRISELEQVDLADKANWDLLLTEEEDTASASLLHGVPDPGKILAISLGTKVPAKDWGEGNWRDLVTNLSAQMQGWTAVFSGSTDEYSLSARCAQGWRGKSINICGKATPRVSAAVYKRCSLFIGHDSGPMHLAACVGTPCVAIFSARNLPRQWFPRGSDNRVMYERTECAGCGLHDCIVQAKKCLSAIRPETVAGAVFELIPQSLHR
jgi:heptosyltransferase-3